MIDFELLAIREINTNGMGICLKPHIPAVITLGLINDIRRVQDSLAEEYFKKPWDDYMYVIWYIDHNRSPQWRGMDYQYIYDCLKNNNENDFEDYISKVFDVMLLNYLGLDLPVINCSVVNSTMTGISREFFFINQICFLRNEEYTDISKFCLYDEVDNLIFPDRIYKNNDYYFFNELKPHKMRKLIASTKHELLDRAELEEVKKEFFKLRNTTIDSIYNIAFNNIRILERMANMQALSLR